MVTAPSPEYAMDQIDTGQHWDGFVQEVVAELRRRDPEADKYIHIDREQGIPGTAIPSSGARTDSLFTYLLYKDRMVATMFQRRTDLNYTEAIYGYYPENINAREN